MNTLDRASTPHGWEFLGLSKDGGQWGKIVPSGQPESGNEIAQRQQRAAVKAARFNRLKPMEQRHSDYQYQVANCPISETDRADLNRRGLTDEDLAKLTPINDGKGGYIIPIRDVDGLMVGGQRRLNTSSSGGRYRWATTGENQLKETHELPLAHWSSTESPAAIYLTEGTGVKPYIAAKKLKSLSIGAAGGNFASSSKTLKATLDRYSDLPVLLIPDAGAVANKSVMRQYANLQELLKKWGRELKVLWWGQTSKADGDIDEISADLFTSEISWGEFMAIAIKLGTIEHQPELKAEEKKTKHQTFRTSIDGGLVRVSEDGGETKIGDHLVAIARVNNPDGDGAAILLEFLTMNGSTRRWTMPRAALSGDGSLITEALLAMDYSYRRGRKSALLDYLHEQGKGIDRTFTITDSTGWVKNSFVTQAKTYGDNDLKFRDVENVRDTTCEVAGTNEGWCDRVAKFCGGNSRMIFSLGIAYAAPLLEPLEIESGGFHFYHSTSAGKTTLLMVAASVVGIRKIPQWNTTANGLEATATAHNNMLLPLDEIGEANEKEVGKMAYMLANGQGKTRMTKQLTNRKPKTWKLLFASTGEVGMADYIKQAGVQVKGGQEVRMPDIPAVPKDSPYGVFENIHGAKDSKEFAQALELACAENHGTAIDAYLSRLVVDLASEDTKKILRKKVLLIADNLTGSISNFAIRRVANRFALVQVALGQAHSYGLLPFPVEDIDWAVSTLFQDWLTARGGDGSIEIKNACDAIGYLLTTQENGERFFTLPDNNGLKPRN
jgi:uncharacterized protein (DUF927 family)